MKLTVKLIHGLSWDIKANTKIEMQPDKIIISSPGGLVADMSKEDYIKGNYSYLRNPIIANVFRRLNIIESITSDVRRFNNIKHNKTLLVCFYIYVKYPLCNKCAPVESGGTPFQFLYIEQSKNEKEYINYVQLDFS